MSLEDRILYVLRRYGSMNVQGIANYINRSSIKTYEYCLRLRERRLVDYSTINHVQIWQITHHGLLQIAQ